MKKMEPLSNKPAPSPASSLKSEDFPSQANQELPLGYYPLPQPVEKLTEVLVRLTNLDFARWGALVIEDLGVFDIDRVIGSADTFGAKIRAELCGPAGKLNYKWAEVASRIAFQSPATNNPTMLLAALAHLAAAKLYTDGRVGPDA
jgi:hypothetical protein